MLGGVLAQVPRYRCQVVGARDADGNPFLYLNFLHEDAFADEEDAQAWTRDLILVDDGGDHYWQVRYTPADGSYEDLQINGEA